MIPGPSLRGDQSGDLDAGGPAGYANVMVFGPNSEMKYVAPSGGQYVSL
jgi:cell wall assembly regulator SMI1